MSTATEQLDLIARARAELREAEKKELEASGALKKAERRRLHALHCFFARHFGCPADSIGREERIKHYQRRAAERQPLFAEGRS